VKPQILQTGKQTKERQQGKTNSKKEKLTPNQGCNLLKAHWNDKSQKNSETK